MLAAINKVMLPVNTKDKVYVPFVAWKMNDGVGQCEMSRDGARETSMMTSRMISPVLMSRSSCRKQGDRRGDCEASPWEACAINKIPCDRWGAGIFKIRQGKLKNYLCFILKKNIIIGPIFKALFFKK